MRVTILSTHVNHALSRQPRARYAEVALRTAVQCAAAGHAVTLIVFRGWKQHLVLPNGAAAGAADAPYHVAQQCVDRVVAESRHLRESFAANPHGLEGDDGIDVPDLPDHIANGGDGRLDFEFVDPPPVRHVVNGYSQDWPVAIMSRFPPASDCVIDGTGPDVLNASHVDADARAIKFARTRVDRWEREGEQLAGGEEDQWSLGNNDFPSINNVVGALVQHTQAMKTMSTFLREAKTLRPQAPRALSDDRRSEIDDQFENVVKVWFLNDWRALDISVQNRMAMAKVRGFKGPPREGAYGAACAAGILHQSRRVWKYSDELGDWSALCLPPLKASSLDLTAMSLDELRDAGGISEGSRLLVRISTNSVPLRPLGIEDHFPLQATGAACLSRLLRSQPSVDTVAGFLSEHLVRRAEGAGEQLNNAAMKRRAKAEQIGQSVASGEELSKIVRESSKKDADGNVFTSLTNHSNSRFTRRRVGIAQGNFEPLSMASLPGHIGELKQVLEAYGAKEWPATPSPRPFGAACGASP